eukprot:scpid97588/ scgid13231/ 
MSSESQQLVPKKEAKLGLRAKIAALRAKKALIERQREECEISSESKERVAKKEPTLDLSAKAATLRAKSASSERGREEFDGKMSEDKKPVPKEEEPELKIRAESATLKAQRATSERRRQEDDRQRACTAAGEPYKVQFQTNADSSTDQDRPYGALKVTKSALPLQSSLPLDPRVWWELSQHRTLEPAYLRTTREGRVRINKMKRDAAKRQQLE